MSEPLDAVTLGEAMVLLLGEPALPLASSLHYRRSVAGAESNVAIGLARRETSGLATARFDRMEAEVDAVSVLIRE